MLRRILLFIAATILLANHAAAQLIIDGDALESLPSRGFTVHPSVAPAPGRSGRALAFSGGGLQGPTRDHLSPDAGSIDFWCKVPNKWPASQSSTLFEVGFVHKGRTVLLFNRTGVLTVVFRPNGETPPAITAFQDSSFWLGDSWHHIQFWWQCYDQRLSAFLRVDDRMVASLHTTPPEALVGRFTIGTGASGKDAWHGLLDSIRVAPKSIDCPETQPGARNIEVDADRTVGDCYRFWSIHNFTNQDEFSDAGKRNWVRHLYPFMRYVNCIRLIGGRSDGKNAFFKGTDADGQPQCDFDPMLAYLRGILAWGYTPRIVLDNVPTAMSGSGEMHKYGNTDPPKDYELYHRYIQAVVQAMVDEFGLDRVRTWRFRVMTEPDLHPGHWAGTKEEYLKLYDYAVDAVTHVIPDADIGPGNILNPGVLPTDQSRAPRWGLDIIDHAATGTNYRTGKTGTRMRFMSCSWYGRVGRCIDSFDLAVEHMRSRLDVYPQSRELPVEVAEFAPLLAENGAWLSGGEASEWGGSWMAAIADRVYQRHVRQVHQWATTTNGMPLPRTHVLAMLERMVGGQRLAVTSNGTTAVKCGAIACQKDGRLQILVYHHRPARYPKPTEHVTLTIRDRRMVAGQSWILSERLTDANHGTFIHDFYSDCEKAGIKPVSDEPPFGGQVRGRYGDEGGKLLRKGYNKYMAQARLPETKTDEPVAVADGQLTLHFDMDCHSVRLLELTPSRPAP